MTEILSTFLIFGGIIFAGFISSLIFEKLRIPNIILLMLLGLLLGPILGIVGPETIASMKNIAAVFGTLVLLILLLAGGMSLNFYTVLTRAGEATIFTVLVFSLNLVFVTAILSIAGWQLVHALLMGAILAGNSNELVIFLLQRIKASEKIKTIATLETSLNDIPSIILAILLIQIIVSGNAVLNLQQIGQDFFGSFAIGGFFAIAAGFAWIVVLKKIPVKPYGYLLTLGAVMLLYVASESVKGNGAFAALIFGIVLGNAREIAQGFKIPGEFSLSDAIRDTQEEIIFFVSTFFFVYMGLITDLTLTSAVVALTIAIVASKIIAREIAIRALIKIDPDVEKERKILLAFIPNGLTAAAVAAYPLTFGVPGAELFLQTAFLVILFSNIIGSLIVFWVEHATPKQPVKTTQGQAQTRSSAPAGFQEIKIRK